MHRVIVDTDPGVDDCVAMMFALASGAFEIDAITTVFGNCSVEQSTRNALAFLDLVGADIPVYQGSAESVAREPSCLTVDNVHGVHGLGPYEAQTDRRPENADAVQTLIDRVTASPGEITVLALGPLTNLARAVERSPSFVRDVAGVVFMGGIVAGPGNVGPFATANILNDPEAAQLILHKIPNLVMVGQDVTRTFRVLPAQADRLAAVGGAAATFFKGITDYYATYYGRFEPSPPGFPVHDLLVLLYICRRQLFLVQDLFVNVETKGEWTTGMTVADLRQSASTPPNVRVCRQVDREAGLAYFEATMLPWLAMAGAWVAWLAE